MGMHLARSEIIMFFLASSFIFLYLLGTNIQIEATSLWTFYENLQLGKIFIAELIMTMIIGLISSISAVEQYLKGKLAINN